MLKKSHYILAAASLVLASFPLQAQKIKATINFAQPTAGIAVDPLTDRVYVVAPSFGGDTDTLSVINGKTNKVISNISIPPGAYLPVVDYFTNRVYVATCNSNVEPIACSITVVDTLDNTVASKIPVTTTDGDGLLGISINLASNKIYVANASDGVVDVIDGRSHKIVKVLPVSSGEPVGLATNFFLNKLYVPLGNGSVDVWDTQKNVLMGTSAVGGADSFAAVNLASGNVYVTDAEAGPSSTFVLDKNGASLASVVVGDTPYGLDVDPFTSRAFVASTALNNVTVIDTNTNAAIATVPNVAGTFVAVNYLNHDVYVSGSTGVTVLTEK